MQHDVCSATESVPVSTRISDRGLPAMKFKKTVPALQKIPESQWEKNFLTTENPSSSETQINFTANDTHSSVKFGSPQSETQLSDPGNSHTGTAAKLESKALAGLAKRVRGFSVKEVKTTYELDEEGDRIVKNETVVCKQVPPDLSAIIFTLTNLNRERWQVKPVPENPETENTLSDPDDEADLSRLSDQALREIAGLTESGRTS